MKLTDTMHPENKSGIRKADFRPVSLVGVLAKRAEFGRVSGDFQIDGQTAREPLAWTPPFTVDEGWALTVPGVTAPKTG